MGVNPRIIKQIDALEVRVARLPVQEPEWEPTDEQREALPALREWLGADLDRFTDRELLCRLDWHADTCARLGEVLEGAGLTEEEENVVWQELLLALILHGAAGVAFSEVVHEGDPGCRIPERYKHNLIRNNIARAVCFLVDMDGQCYTYLPRPDRARPLLPEVAAALREYPDAECRCERLCTACYYPTPTRRSAQGETALFASCPCCGDVEGLWPNWPAFMGRKWHPKNRWFLFDPGDPRRMFAARGAER